MKSVTGEEMAKKEKNGGKQEKVEEVLAESWLIGGEEKMRWVEEKMKKGCVVFSQVPTQQQV